MMVYDVIVSVAATPQSGAAADTARLHLYTRLCLYPDAVLGAIPSSRLDRAIGSMAAYHLNDPGFDARTYGFLFFSFLLMPSFSVKCFILYHAYT